jgi:hypothetical protein
MDVKSYITLGLVLQTFIQVPFTFRNKLVRFTNIRWFGLVAVEQWFSTRLINPRLRV